MFFTDRPVRDTGVVSETALLEALFIKGKPVPNAAVEVLGASKDQDVLAVKLTDPRYNARSQTLSYVVSRLHNLTPGLRHYRRSADSRLPTRFGSVSLFIDSGTIWGNTCRVNITDNTKMVFF